MGILAESNTANLIAALFFLACGGYIYISINTIVTDFRTKLNREHFSAVVCVILSCLFYGLMTIAKTEAAMRIFWAVGYVSYFLFLPIWIRFVSNMVTIRSKTIRHLARWVLPVISFCLSVVCVLCNQVEFRSTVYGNHFTFNGSLLSRIVALFVFGLCIVVIISHIRWWRESKMERQRVQQRTFLLFTLLFAPVGFVTDFIVPAFFSSITITPLVSILLFPAAIQLYFSMRANKTISITVPNVSGYIFKSVMIPTLVLDHDNTARLENKAAIDFFGRSLIGKDISEILFLDDNTLDRHMLDSEAESKNITIETPSGTRICDLLLTMENDKYGDALCKVVMLRDMTDIKEAMKQIEKANEELLATSAQLEVALSNATMASKAKSDFLANMSHEMRTPMNAIIGMSHIGINSDDPSRKDYSLGRIEDASKHLLGVINDVLDVSKIEAGKFELSHTAFDFEKVLKRVLNVLKYRADEKMQTLTIKVDDEIPGTLVGDDQRLAQVIANILGNAIKFTPEKGTIGLRAKLLSEERDVCLIEVSVTDTGMGISHDQQDKLFESFHQTESSTTRNFGGTGLGLSISRSIVEMMGGRIWVESEYGKGSTFTFTVELKSGEYDYSGSQPAEDSHPAISGTYEGRKILLVEDVEINREIVLTFLEPTMVAIDCAENGAEAVRMFEESPEKYDLLFMDIQMPEMDGYEATRTIRSLDSQNAKKVPIIAMTANVFREDVEKCLDSGMNGHVGKPINFDELSGWLRQCLG